MSEIQYIGDSRQGMTHIENQDGFIMLDKEEFLLFAVFDGVSRSRNPLKGVHTSVKFIQNNFSQYIKGNTMKLKEMMYYTNQMILQTGVPESLTTYALAGFFRDNPLLIFHSNLGDSRIYHITENSVQQLSTDDSLWPGSHILTKCLGGDYLSSVDFREALYQAEQGFLFLATDGCYSIFEQHREELINKLFTEDLNSFKSIFGEFIKGNNYDDATYIIVKYT